MLTYTLEKQKKESLYEQLYRFIREDILSGRLHSGERLPSKRTLAQHLAVMDSTATSLSMDNHIPVLLFALKDPRNIIRALCGENVGTIVKE